MVMRIVMIMIMSIVLMRVVLIAVIVISSEFQQERIAEAFQAGATGYIVKESAADRLLQGLDSVAAGDTPG